MTRILGWLAREAISSMTSSRSPACSCFGASLGWIAMPPRTAGCWSRMLTVHRAEPMSQPIWTIRSTPTAAAGDQLLQTDLGGVVTPDVEVGVVVHHRERQPVRRLGPLGQTLVGHASVGH